MSQTKLVRINKKVLDEIKTILPNMKTSDMVTAVWNSSVLKLEHTFRQKDFVNNMGRMIYGRKNWNEALQAENRQVKFEQKRQGKKAKLPIKEGLEFKKKLKI